MKKLISMISMALTMLAVATAVFAAEPVTGKVTKVEGDKVTVALEGAVPAWAKKGANVSAMGGSPKVLAVEGSEVTLRFSRAKAAKIKADSNMTLTESDGDDMQGC